MLYRPSAIVVDSVVDSEGETTEVLIPFESWNALLSVWQTTIEEIEDQEDLQILQQWLARRDAGEDDRMLLDEFERELIADELR